jgi:hypothetical protein
MGEELQLKIDENARLHAKLDDIDKRHEEKCAGLQSRSDKHFLLFLNLQSSF